MHITIQPNSLGNSGSNAALFGKHSVGALEHASGLEVGVGVTHRVAWEQGALKVFKWVLGGKKKRKPAHIL